MQQLTYLLYSSFALRLYDPIDTKGVLNDTRIGAELEGILYKIISEMKYI